jgi:putative acetyltransferase
MLELDIQTFRAEHASAFDQLNRASLIEHGLLEPVDEHYLTDPWGSILTPGGQIFVAVRDGEVLGTCAVVPASESDAEIVKLVVAPAARGQGLGRRLVEACLAHARNQGFRRIVLLSSTRLGMALKLYESLGFEHRPLPAVVPYATADVYMERVLD